MTAAHYTGLAATAQGRARQFAKAFHGMADEMKRRAAEQPADCDEPQTLEEAKRVIAYLQNKLTDAQNLINDMRESANSDAPTVSAGKPVYWDTARVARESNTAVCTICRNAQTLGGMKLGGEWLFPAGTTYGKRRNRK